MKTKKEQSEEFLRVLYFEHDQESIPDAIVHPVGTLKEMEDSLSDTPTTTEAFVNYLHKRKVSNIQELMAESFMFGWRLQLLKASAGGGVDMAHSRRELKQKLKDIQKRFRRNEGEDGED